LTYQAKEFLNRVVSGMIDIRDPTRRKIDEQEILLPRGEISEPKRRFRSDRKKVIGLAIVKAEIYVVVMAS
jgi:hypothetical protein